jgi:hypothetical protein
LFRRLRQTLQYRELSDNTIGTNQVGYDRRCEHDIGLPLPLLARLGEKKPHILHNLLRWLHHYSDSDTLEQGLRRRIIRYALVDYFFLQVNTEFRTKSFAVCGQATSDFPDGELIELAAGQPSAGNGEIGGHDLRIEAFRGTETNLLASPEALEGYIAERPDPVDLNDLLLWAQRSYLHRRFPDYDPTLFFNVSALPWDKDHIWPQAKMDGRTVRIDTAAWEMRHHYQWLYLHSFGNFRLLDRRDNRSDHDKLPAEKLTNKNNAEEDFAIAGSAFDHFC